jgi:hypothetical protein
VVSLALIAVFAYTFWANPSVIQFKKYSAADFTQQLTPLVLVSLFIERGLEIFITVWRGGKAARLQSELEQAKALPDTNGKKADEMRKAGAELRAYKVSTQQIALPSGLVVGVVIASLGVRGLSNFADLDKLSGATQKYLFNLADVLLTGAVMGGGSDFMHKLITTFTDLMEATSQKAKGAVP